MQRYISEELHPPIETCFNPECCFVLGLMTDVEMAIEHSHAAAVGHVPGHLLGTVLSLLVIQILLLSSSQDSLVSIVTRWWNGSSVPSSCRKFSVYYVCISSWTPPISSLMLTDCCSTHGAKVKNV